MTEPEAAAARPAPPAEPPASTDYILSQAEFHQTVRGLQFETVRNLETCAAREAIGLRQFFGWVLATFGCLALLLGLAILYSRDGMDVGNG